MPSSIQLISDYCNASVVMFGDFTLKSGTKSHIYFNFRTLVSFPHLLSETAGAMWEMVAREGLVGSFDSVCGVPYTALPIATCISVDQKVPMIVKRKEAKDHGLKNLIDGSYDESTRCLIIEDVVTTGSSVIETVEVLRAHGIKAVLALAILDRQEGGAANLAQHGIQFFSLFTREQFVSIGQKLGKIPTPADADASSRKKARIAPCVGADPIRHLLEKRKSLLPHPTSRQLVDIMIKKRTNLCVAIDLTKCEKVLEMIRKVAVYACMIKLHVDIIEDFSDEFVRKLTELSSNLNFLIFEDRKFADIGNTVSHQFHKGLFHISQFSDVTNAHVVAGQSIIDGLTTKPDGNGDYKCKACLLVAEMSSKGNLMDSNFIESALLIAKNNPAFVIGFICQRALDKSGSMLHFTPGVSLRAKEDTLGQTYVSPKKALDRGTDVVIVGRDITLSEDPAAEALKYQQIYEETIISSIV